MQTIHIVFFTVYVMQIVTTWYLKSTHKKTPYILNKDYFSI